MMASNAMDRHVKEKVQSVREVVPGKNTNEIVLVLQYYDYNVEKVVQAYMEDGAREALSVWHVPAGKPSRKKKRNRKNTSDSAAQELNEQPLLPTNCSSDSSCTNICSGSVLPEHAPDSADAAVPVSKADSPSLPVNGIIVHGGMSSALMIPSENQHLPECNGVEIEGKHNSLPGSPSLPLQSDTTSEVCVSQASQSKAIANHPKLNSDVQTYKGSRPRRNRTRSQQLTSVTVPTSNARNPALQKKPYQGLEKAIKDLQRQNSSLDWAKSLLDRELDRCHKSIKSVFSELRSHLDSREGEILSEMASVKEQGNDAIGMRQQKSAFLKMQIDGSEKLSEAEMSALKSDVKHFIADRKIDEELGKTTRFRYDSDHLRQEINNFGEVIPVKCCYSASRMLAPSVASSTTGTDHDAFSVVSSGHYSSAQSLSDTGSCQRGERLETSGPAVVLSTHNCDSSQAKQ